MSVNWEKCLSYDESKPAHKKPTSSWCFFNAVNNSSCPGFSIGHQISIPSYPSFFALAQYSSSVPGKPQLVAMIFNSNPVFMLIFDLRGFAKTSRDVSIRAVDEDAVHFKKFLRFNISGLKLRLLFHQSPVRAHR